MQKEDVNYTSELIQKKFQDFSPSYDYTNRVFMSNNGGTSITLSNSVQTAIFTLPNTVYNLSKSRLNITVPQLSKQGSDTASIYPTDTVRYYSICSIYYITNTKWFSFSSS